MSRKSKIILWLLLSLATAAASIYWYYGFAAGRTWACGWPQPPAPGWSCCGWAFSFWRCAIAIFSVRTMFQLSEQTGAMM